MLEKANEILEEVKTQKPSRFLLSIGDMQTFADGDGGQEGGQEGQEGQEGGSQGQGSEGAEGGTGGTENPGGDDQKGQGEDKTFSQEDVNKIAAKEAKKATEKLLKQLGVTDFNSAKDGLKKFKEYQDSQKTEAQKAEERAKELEKENATVLSRAETLEAELTALKADVNPDSVGDVVVLAKNLLSEDVDMNDAIKQVLKKYPHFKRDGQQQEGEGKKKPKPKFSEGEHQQGDKPSEAELWASAFKF